MIYSEWGGADCRPRPCSGQIRLKLTQKTHSTWWTRSFFLFQFLKTQIKRGQIVLFFTLLLFTFHQLCPCFLVYFYLIWGVMCSSAPSLDYDSRKQVMFSISSLVTVWTNWNRTQNSICAVLGPATTSRLLSSAFFYSFFLCMANKTPLWPTLTRQGSLRKSRCTDRDALCVFLVGFGDREIRSGFFSTSLSLEVHHHIPGEKKVWPDCKTVRTCDPDYGDRWSVCT